MHEITVVIPTIGGVSEKSINEAIASAIAAKRENDRIIICDNSQSRDLHEMLLRRYQQRADIEIISSQKRLSMAENWNFGLEHVRTDWVLYLHDDDMLISKALHDINKALDTNAAFVCGDYCLNKNGKSHIVKRGAMSLQTLIADTPKFASTIINTNKLKAIGGWDNAAGYFVDTLGFILLFMEYGAVSIPKVIGEYRIHSSNASAPENRNRGYGDAFPYYISKVFGVIKDMGARSLVLNHALLFMNPSPSRLVELINKVLFKIRCKSA